MKIFFLLYTKLKQNWITHSNLPSSYSLSHFWIILMIFTIFPHNQFAQIKWHQSDHILYKNHKIMPKVAKMQRPTEYNFQEGGGRQASIFRPVPKKFCTHKLSHCEPWRWMLQDAWHIRRLRWPSHQLLCSRRQECEKSFRLLFMSAASHEPFHCGRLVAGAAPRGSNGERGGGAARAGSSSRAGPLRRRSLVTLSARHRRRRSPTRTVEPRASGRVPED